MHRKIRLTNTIRLLLCISLLVITQPLYAEVVANNPIIVEVTTHLGDKQTFKQGDMIAFLVNLDKDAYILMIYQDSQKNLIQVIPNRYRQETLYEAGLFIPVPNQNEPFEFTVSAPFGEEKLWVFASTQKFPSLEGIELNNGLKQLKHSLEDVLQTVRPKDPDIGYGESNTTIITEPN